MIRDSLKFRITNRIGRLGMAAFALMLLGELTGAGIPQQKPADPEAAILDNSEIRYRCLSHWGTIWEPTKDYLTWFEYSAVCRNGQVEIVAKGKLWKDPGLIKELSRRIADISDYLKLWDALDNLRTWSLESKDPIKAMDEPLRKGLNEKAEKALLDMYPNFMLEQDTYGFFLRVRDRIHEFQAYDVPGLKDQTYSSILKEMVHFFGYAPPRLPLAQIWER